MKPFTISISSILDGRSPTQYIGTQGSFLSSLAIDPDLPINSSTNRTSGAIVPVAYSKFSGSNVAAAPIAIITNPKNNNVYVVTTGGKLVSYSSSLGSETLVGTVAGSNARGAFYYNNYIYITGTGASKDDISRYGPLNNSPSLVDNVWKGSTLGSLTALTDTTYPSLRGVALPNHWGFAHTDGSAYFCDFANGQGLIHRINTKKVTNEGDTNGTTVPSAYNVLDLPFGWYPVDICNYGTDLAILAFQTVDTTVNQGRAALFLWDTYSNSFYRQIPLADPLATAMENVNGLLRVWTGNASNGVRLSSYLGGDLFREEAFLEEGVPPFPGAVDSFGSRIVWGGYVTDPASAACVWSFGSKNSKIPMGIHNIAKATSSTTTNQNITALKYVQQSSNVLPQLVLGWNDNAGSGLDKYSASGTMASVFRTQTYNIGGGFKINKIRIGLGAAIAANMTIVPKLYVDEASNSNTLQTINSTNWSLGPRSVNLDTSITGSNNFFLELAFSSTSPLPVVLPIIIEGESDYAFADSGY